MSFEWIKAKENEKKLKEINEKDLEKQEEKRKDFLKTKEEIEIKQESDKKLDNLKELIAKWVISKETAEHIAEWHDIDKDEIEDMFEKIDQIEDVKNIDKYLPTELRITKDEYIKALENPIFRVQMITKLNTALTILAEQINPDSSIGLNLFSGFLSVLDKNLIIIQENTIDIKESLEEIDVKSWKNTKKQWFFDLIKEIFTSK